jgi:hypothetical protein
MKDFVKGLNIGGAIADDLIESGEERQAVLSERHKADMGSDSWLSKSVRPITLLVLLGLQILIVLLSSFGFHADPTIVGQHGLLLFGAFSFYFHSKKIERVAEKNAAANVKMEEIRIKHSNKMERKEVRAERRSARREERTQETED